MCVCVCVDISMVTVIVLLIPYHPDIVMYRGREFQYSDCVCVCVCKNMALQSDSTIPMTRNITKSIKMLLIIIIDTVYDSVRVCVRARAWVRV